MHERREALRQAAALRIWTTRYVTFQRHRKRAVCKMVGVCAAAAPEDGRAAALRLDRELLHEPRLADTGLSGHDDQAALCLVGSRELLAELTTDGIAADERHTLPGGRPVNRLHPSWRGLRRGNPRRDSVCLNLPVELDRRLLRRQAEFAFQRVLTDLELAHGLVACSQ